MLQYDEPVTGYLARVGGIFACPGNRKEFERVPALFFTA